jgi:peroxiredoxin
LKYNTLSLSALNGRTLALVSEGWTLLCFFKVDCPTSLLVVPYVERLYRTFGDTPRFRVLGISQNEYPTTQVFVAANGMTFPVLLDEGWQASTAFDPLAVPALFLVDQAGQVLAAQGGLDKEWLNEVSARIARHLDYPPVEIAPAGDCRPIYRPG